MVELKTGYQIIADILAQPDFQSQIDLSRLLSRLVPYIKEYSLKRIGTHANPDCKTEYTENHLENIIWALGLICQEWILQDLYMKAADGHCYTHKPQARKPCPKGSQFHYELYKMCKKSFREALEKPL